MRPVALALASAFFLVALPVPVHAQDPGVKIAVGDVGLGIGDVPRLDGLRLNFRDRHLERVRGVNVTVWYPYEELAPDARVTGLALGLPLTGAGELRGVALGFGVGAERDLTGIGLAPLGLGAGERVQGIAVGGLGVGAGGSVDGILVGGLGAGLGGDLRGVAIGGVGIGTGGSVTGIVIGGVGLGAGEDVTGITIGGVGVGAGGELRGLSVGGIGVGASSITGLAVGGLGVGGREVRGVVLAPGYFQVIEGGSVSGVSISAFNDVRGRQHGLSIGILNIAEELHGLQIGLLNIARNKESFSVLPLVNYSR